MSESPTYNYRLLGILGHIANQSGGRLELSAADCREAAKQLVSIQVEGETVVVETAYGRRKAGKARAKSRKV